MLKGFNNVKVKDCVLLTFLQFTNIFFNYFLSRIPDITYLNAVPISLISIIIISKHQYKRFLYINFPVLIILLIPFIDDYLANGFSILLFYIF